MVTMASALPMTTTTGEATCPACARAGTRVVLGHWDTRDGRPVFRPYLHGARSIEVGDGWLALRCRRCDTRTVLACGDSVV